jgi:hypothetical protein
MIDRRTEEHRQTHTLGVVGTDAAMSALLRECRNGRRVSYAVWATRPEHVDECISYVLGRGEMRRVRVVDLRTYRPRSDADVSYYVYEPQRRGER